MIHNAYLSIWLKTGLLGLLSFLCLSFRFLVRGLRHWRDAQDGFLRAVTLGFALAYLAMMISNLVTSSFVNHWNLAIYGVILGINEVVFAHNWAHSEFKLVLLRDFALLRDFKVSESLNAICSGAMFVCDGSDKPHSFVVDGTQ
jgi:cell division protein FtsW (lipid II flippase)